MEEIRDYIISITVSIIIIITFLIGGYCVYSEIKTGMEKEIIAIKKIKKMTKYKNCMIIDNFYYCYNQIEEKK